MDEDLQRIRNADLPVTWGTLLVGSGGLGHSGPLVTPAAISAYALDRLSTGSEPRAELVELLDGPPNDQNELTQLLRSLAQADGADLALEERKWRLVLLERLLNSLGPDPIDGLLELTEFWLGLGFPEDSPHVVQGRDNSIQPGRYYTVAKFQEALARHKEWLADEAQRLRMASAATRVSDALSDG